MATRLDPFQELDRLFAQVLTAERASATMPMDLYRSGDHYVLHVDLPGADPGTIDVNVEDRTLTIRAQRTARAEQDVQWLAKERPVGTYARQLTVGRGLALDAISATYADGVLTLTIPVADEAKPRRIEVQHAGDTAAAHRRGGRGRLTDDGGGAPVARAPRGPGTPCAGEPSPRPRPVRERLWLPSRAWSRQEPLSVRPARTGARGRRTPARGASRRPRRHERRAGVDVASARGPGRTR